MAYSHGNLLHWNFQRPIYLGQTITFTIQNADTLIMNTTIAYAQRWISPTFTKAHIHLYTYTHTLHKNWMHKWDSLN